MNKRVGLGFAVLVVVAAVVWMLSSGSEEPSAPASPNTGTIAASPVPDGAPSIASLRKRAAAIEDGGVPEVKREPGVIATFSWGSGENQLGRRREQESSPEAPMSLTVDGKGNLWVLDQINGRLVRVDKNGKPLESTPLSVQGAQDVVISKDGTAVVLDRLVDKSIALVGPDGKPRGELKLEGKNLDEGGGSVTGVFTDGDDVYVEREHGDLVKVGDTKGKSDPEREEVPGRPSRDGTMYLNAGIAEVPGNRAYVNVIERASKAHRFTREYTFPAELTAITLLDSDRSGIIYFGVVTMLEGPRPAGLAEHEQNPNIRVTGVLLCLDPLDGRPLGRAEIPVNTNADETFREMTVLDEGGVVFLQRTEEQAQLKKYDCR